MSQSSIKLSSWRPHHPQPFVSAPQVEEVLILPLLLDAGVLGPVIEDPIQGEHPQPVALVDTCLPRGLQLHPRMSVIMNTLIAWYLLIFKWVVGESSVIRNSYQIYPQIIIYPFQEYPKKFDSCQHIFLDLYKLARNIPVCTLWCLFNSKYFQ